MSDWLSGFLVHAVDIEFLANYEAETGLDILLALESEIEEELRKANSVETKRQLTECQRKVTELIEVYFAEIDEKVYKRLPEIAESEADWISGFALASLGVSLAVPKNVGKTASLMPITVSNTAKSAIQQVRDSISNSYKATLQRSYYLGESLSDSMEGIQQRIKSANNGFKAEVQTTVSSVARNARNSVVRNNPEVFRSFMWCSILDSNTCLVCGEMHGTVFNRFNAAPFIPVHERCRCELIPYTEDEPPEMEYDSYEEWIEAQDEETQRNVLGKTRFELWKNKEITLDRFISDNRKLRLEELNIYKSSGFGDGADDKRLYSKYHREGKIFGYSTMSAEEQERARAYWLLRKQSESGVERCIVYDDLGRILDINKGSKFTVSPSGRFLAGLDGEIKYNIIHNHVNNAIFSPEDILNVVQIKNVESGSVVLANGSVFTISRGSGKIVSEADFSKVYDKYYEKYVSSKKYNGLDEKTQLYDSFLKTLAKKYGWDYNYNVY